MQDCNISGIKDQKVRSSIYSLLGLLANISLQSNQHQKVLSQYNALCASIEKKKKRKKLLSHFYEIFNSQKTSILKLVTDRFHAAMCLFSNRSKMTPKCDKNKEAQKVQLSMSQMFLSFFISFSDLLLYRPTATWNLFVSDHIKAKPCY